MTRGQYAAPPVAGHSVVRRGPGDWHCTCGQRLSGGPYGSGRAGARDVMRFHRADLWMAARASRSTTESGTAS